MPIKGLSETRRLPRLGKIHLGIKKTNAQGKEYPTAVDYFVCPETITKVYGDKPKSLPILIPVEDEEKWCSQYYRAYSKTRGLVCKGNGETATRLIDAKTGEFTWKDDASEVVMKEVECKGKDCVDYQNKRCRPVMMLQFLLPQVPGLGIWQVDTGSINAILNINSAAELIRRIHGRVSLIPLTLTLEMQQVTTPDRKKVNKPILNLRAEGTLKEMIASAKTYLALPEGVTVDPVEDEDVDPLILPMNQAPLGQEPTPEIQEEVVVPTGKPWVEMPKTKQKPADPIGDAAKKTLKNEKPTEKSKVIDMPTKCEVCGKIAELAYSDAQGIFVCVDCVTK
jgi:hypothetical protein